MTLVLFLLACGEKETHDDSSPIIDTEPDWILPDGGVIELTTIDGVTLVADYYPVDEEGAAAVVLLHMIPPTWDRTSWPGEFISALNAEGWAVLVPDRRGAGDSGGQAQDAYLGPNGKYDAAACMQRLADDGYGPVAIVAGSNGTTTTLDYTLWSETAGTAAVWPVALGFMTGGTYTEAQNSMSDLGVIPMIFTYSTVERAWSVAQQDLGHDEWVFLEYEGGAHGTQMFDAKPEVKDDLVDFLKDHL